MPSKKRAIVIAMSVAVLLLITGFSLFSTRLTINGISEVTSSWKVYFESIEKTSVEGAATEASSPKIFNTTIEFEVNLRKPGDSITYTAVLKNGGTIGAIVNNIDASVTATESSTYTVTGIKKGDKLAAGQSKEITIKVEYDRDYTAVPDEKTNDLIINIECVQDAGQTVTGEDLIIQKPKVIRANGDIDTVGTDLQIGNEHFYIISSDSTKVVALAKYNLDVNTGDSTTTYKGTGIQSPHAVGHHHEMEQGYAGGTVEYYLQSTPYWTSTCTSYPCEIYNSQTRFYSFVENYKAYLETLGAKISSARVISYDELIRLGCSGTSCAQAPSWLSGNFGYWTSTANTSGTVYAVGRSSYNPGGGLLGGDEASIDYNNGVRPVIEVLKSEISVNKKTIKIQANGDVTKVGTDIQIGDEHFYVISNSNGKITALAKYNLDINTGDTSTTYKGTGKQDSNVNGSTKGAIAYSEKEYWSSYASGDSPYDTYKVGSNTYDYVEKYKLYLESLGVQIRNARLITNSELVALGCTYDGHACYEFNGSAGAPTWVYGMAYWTGTSYNGGSELMIDADGNYDYLISSTTGPAGVRPVIEIDASIFNVKANGDITKVGTDIQIGNEHFYVISSDSTKVTALARYNLDINAGNYIYKGTGIQDRNVIGLDDKNSKLPTYGNISYSDSAYWDDTCTTYPCEVYNSSSNLYQYMNSYETYLESLNVSILRVRPIKYDELISLGCVGGNDYTCEKSSYSWVYSTSYWSSTAETDFEIFLVLNSNLMFGQGYNDTSFSGVRPVIEIPRSAFQ